jgi:hypothetical protein
VNGQGAIPDGVAGNTTLPSSESWVHLKYQTFGSSQLETGISAINDSLDAY